LVDKGKMMLFQPHAKIVFIGDSITDCGRNGAAAPYGDGYVSLVRSLLLARYPDLGLRFVNKGTSGNTVKHLRSRWERDVVAEQPDWVSVKIGINDVWRTFDSRGIGAVALDDYVATYRQLLDRTREATGARLILIEPYMIEPDKTQPMRAQMDQYGARVRELAHTYDATLVRAQEAFDIALQHSTPSDWADDKIHPNQPGHAIIALAFLRAVGFELGA
jgi:lysophospholipase L1-like esterase